MSVPVPSFSLLSEPWIPVLDLDAAGADRVREVGAREALVRAHRLTLNATAEEDLAVLRFLSALHAAALRPATEDAWDQAWQAPALDEDRVSAYLDRWADRFGLFDHRYPFAQCAALAAPNRPGGALSVTSYGGTGGFRMWGEISEHGSWGPAEAARLLLAAHCYSPAGIKTAAPGEPSAKGGKVYGGTTGTLGLVTHLHLEGETLKDTLLLNCLPGARAEGDAPAWEQDEPPAHLRVREPRGPLDWATWPTRRLRLFPTRDAGGALGVTSLAVHDGDRAPDPLAAALAHDPHTAWHEPGVGEDPRPFRLTGPDGHPQPWAAAVCLPGPPGPDDAPDRNTSPVLAHALRAAARHRRPAALTAVLARAEYGTLHRSTITATHITPCPLTLSPRDTALVHSHARFAQHTLAVLAEGTKSLYTDGERHVSHLSLGDLASAWARFVRTLTATDDDDQDGRSSACERWQDEVRQAALLAVSALPVPTASCGLEPREALADTAHERARRYLYSRSPHAQSLPGDGSPRVPAPRAKTGTAAKEIEAFGETFRSLVELAADPRCTVSYATLAKRVREDKLTPHDAATALPVRQGIEAFGETFRSLVELAADPRCTVSYATLLRRVREDKLAPHEAATRPPGGRSGRPPEAESRGALIAKRAKLVARLAALDAQLDAGAAQYATGHAPTASAQSTTPHQAPPGNPPEELDSAEQ
ncbi:type I-E CRISPR-associated protein Cse1/CasA [Streptomyces sp. NPDC001054]